MQCRLVTIEQVPPGIRALRLFVVNCELNAGIVERRCDGRVILTEATQRGVDGIIPTITELLARQPEHLLVILEEDAYWPETFPEIRP